MTDLETEVERAYQMLSMYGIPRERARSVANGIEVLATRIRRSLPERVCKNCNGTGIVTGLHNWKTGGTRTEECWQCKPYVPPNAVDMRIFELETLISESGDRRDWQACDTYQKELDFLRGDEKPVDLL
jgi:hypothetical protein